MTWVKIDDAMPEHPKVVGLSDGAFRVHISAICYAARNLTDGMISAGVVRQYGWQRRVRELIEARVWDPVEGGFNVHDYLEYNPSREQVTAEREASRKRLERWRKRGSNAAGNAVTNGVDTDAPVPDPDPGQEQQDDPPLPPRGGEAAESGREEPGKALTRRLWDVHEELSGRITPPPVTDEHQFEQWIRDGLTDADIDAAREEIRAWDTVPEKPWAAFKEALGRIVARRRMGGSDDGRTETSGAGSGRAVRGGGPRAWPGGASGGRRGGGGIGIPTAALPRRESDPVPDDYELGSAVGVG